jgi:hypothetical protein
MVVEEVAEGEGQEEIMTMTRFTGPLFPLSRLGEQALPISPSPRLPISPSPHLLISLPPLPHDRTEIKPPAPAFLNGMHGHVTASQGAEDRLFLNLP